MLKRLAWSIGLGGLATMAWLVASPVQELAAAGHLQQFITRGGTSNEALARMWRLQLPGTLLACCLFSLAALRASRAGYPAWGTGGAYGTAIGGSLGLLLFASPLPGAPFIMWGATLYLTGLPVVLLGEALPLDVLRLPFTFAGLLAVWPVVVTGVLTSLSVLIGGYVGQMRTRRAKTIVV